MVLLKNGIKIIDNVEIADNFFKRTKGLLGKKSVKDGYGMFFPSCNFIHTFFMQTGIDVVMVDGNFKVVYVRRSMRPFDVAFCPEAVHTFEFGRDVTKIKEIKKGDLLKLEQGD
ncbi:MAG: DUF192 domain-containing protein [Candidatus Goldbacteria bacterium]|nr:DUF192 domain-containing protein [Candidatus Goldiibacteriota bacterium]